MDTTFGGRFEPGSEAYFLDTCLFPPEVPAAIERARAEGLAEEYINGLYSLPEIADLRALEFRLAGLFLRGPLQTRKQVELFFDVLAGAVAASGMSTQLLNFEMQQLYAKPQFTMAAVQFTLQGAGGRVGDAVFDEHVRGLNQVCGILHFAARLLWFGPGQREYTSDIELTAQSAEVVATLVRWRQGLGI